MLLVRIALGLVLAYVVLLVLAWLFQERLAFPAPRAPLPDPTRVGVANGEKIERVTKDGTRRVGWYLRPTTGKDGERRGRTGEGSSTSPVVPRPSPSSPALLWFYGNGENIASIWPIVHEVPPPGAAPLVVGYPGYRRAGRGRPREAGWRWCCARARGTTRATRSAEGSIGTGWGGSSDDRPGHEAVALLFDPPLGVVERALHGRLLGVGELGARRHPAGEFAHGHERAGHLASIDVGIGVARDEQLLEQWQAALFAQHVKRLEDVRAEEPPQQLVTADPPEQRGQHVHASPVVA